MVEQLSIRLLRRLQEEGYDYLISKRSAGARTGSYFPERGILWPETLSSFPLEEDEALSIADALRWMNDEELKQLCVITCQSTDSCAN